MKIHRHNVYAVTHAKLSRSRIFRSRIVQHHGIPIQVVLQLANALFSQNNVGVFLSARVSLKYLSFQRNKYEEKCYNASIITISHISFT